MLRFEWVPDSRIRSSDTTFRVRTRYPPALAASIATAGIRTPLLLAPLGGGDGEALRIVSGWGRFLHRPHGALLPAFILEPAATVAATWDRFLRDNDRWNVIEVARVLARLRALGTLDDDVVTTEKLPLLGVRPARELLRRHLRLLDLPAGVQSFIEAEDLPLRRAETFLRLAGPAALLLAELARAHRWTLNEIAELSGWVAEVARRDGVPPEILLENVRRESAGRKAAFRDLLEERRFPELTEFRRRLADLRDGLRFGVPLAVEWDPHLERPGIRLRIELREAGALEALRRDLAENEESLARFFDIL